MKKAPWRFFRRCATGWIGLCAAWLLVTVGSVEAESTQTFYVTTGEGDKVPSVDAFYRELDAFARERGFAPQVTLTITNGPTVKVESPKHEPETWSMMRAGQTIVLSVNSQPTDRTYAVTLVGPEEPVIRQAMERFAADFQQRLTAKFSGAEIKVLPVAKEDGGVVR